MRELKFTTFLKKKGKCHRKGCKAEFVGPPNRRYCDEHSACIRETGKTTIYKGEVA